MTGVVNSPWERAESKINRLLERVAENDEGPIQGVIIEEPFGYGSNRFLDRLARLKQVNGLPNPAYLSSRHDNITDWPSLAVEILSAAFLVDASHGMERQDLVNRRNAFGEAAFRDAMDELIQEKLLEHGRLDLFIPNLDVLLEKLVPNDHWAFRNILQTLPLAVVATAAAGWRPTRDDAFYEFFNRTTPEGYLETDLAHLAKKAGLKKTDSQALQSLASEMSGRPSLVESAVMALSVDPLADTQTILRSVANTAAPSLHATLANTAKQELLVLSAIVKLGTPIGSGEIAEITGLRTGAVATHLSRLVGNGLLSVDKLRGRNRKYQFSDPVFGVLYAALSTDVSRWSK